MAPFRRLLLQGPRLFYFFNLLARLCCDLPPMRSKKQAAVLVADEIEVLLLELIVVDDVEELLLELLVPEVRVLVDVLVVVVLDADVELLTSFFLQP